MPKVICEWDAASDPKGNVQHIARPGITPAEVEQVLNNPSSRIEISRSSGRPMTFGWTTGGRRIGMVWELVTSQPFTVCPVTAFEVKKGPKR